MSGHDVEHLPLSSAEVKNEWSYTCTSPIRFHGVDRNKFASVNFSYVSNVECSSGIKLVLKHFKTIFFIKCSNFMVF